MTIEQQLQAKDTIKKHQYIKCIKYKIIIDNLEIIKMCRSNPTVVLWDEKWQDQQKYFQQALECKLYIIFLFTFSTFTGMIYIRSHAYFLAKIPVTLNKTRTELMMAVSIGLLPKIPFPYEVILLLPVNRYCSYVVIVMIWIHCEPSLVFFSQM